MRIRDIILGLLFAIIWSSAFTSARIAMFDAPPFLLLSLRFLLSGTIAIVVAYFLGQSINFSKLTIEDLKLIKLLKKPLVLTNLPSLKTK